MSLVVANRSRRSLGSAPARSWVERRHSSRPGSAEADLPGSADLPAAPLVMGQSLRGLGDAEQLVLPLDALAELDAKVLDDSRPRRPNLVFHLHRLDRQQPLALLDGFALLDPQPDDPS